MIQIDNVVVSLDVLRENLCATWMPVKVSVALKVMPGLR